MENKYVEPVMDSNGLYVYPPRAFNVEREDTESSTYTYNGVVLPPLPGPKW